MISTKGRYALRVMIDLAQNQNGNYIPMKEVAKRQELSLKYLERIMPLLIQKALIEGVHGKGGGYRLTRAPEDYTVMEILKVTEGDLAPIACLKNGAEQCPRREHCSTIGMWEGYYKLTEKYFGSITVADLMQ